LHTYQTSQLGRGSCHVNPQLHDIMYNDAIINHVIDSAAQEHRLESFYTHVYSTHKALQYSFCTSTIQYHFGLRSMNVLYRCVVVYNTEISVKMQVLVGLHSTHTCVVMNTFVRPSSIMVVPHFSWRQFVILHFVPAEVYASRL